MTSKTAWLVVNNYIDNGKFNEIYNTLMTAGIARGLSLLLKKTGDILLIPGQAPTFSLPDFIIWWDKDVYLARAYENLGVRLFNSASAVEFCDNKALTTIKLSQNKNITLPKTLFAPKTFPAFGYSNLNFLDEGEKLFGYPMVIKEAYGSFGAQVYLAKNRNEGEAIIKSIGHRDFILQEYIKDAHGEDIRINVVGGRVVASMRRYNPYGDFRSNITNGGKMEKFEPTEEQKKMAVEACHTLGLDFAGVDVMRLKDGSPVICEVNSNPHFKSTLDCTGINVGEHIIEHILNCIEGKI